MEIAKALILAGRDAETGPGHGARGAEASLPGRQPADPVPQPRGAARRGGARGGDPRRPATLAGRSSTRSATDATGGCTCATPSGTAVRLGGALAVRARLRRPTSRCSSSRATRCCASACARTSPPSRASSSTRSRSGCARRPAPALAERRATCSARARSPSCAPASARRPTRSPACAPQGGRVRVQRVDGCLPCHGDLAALLESNRRMLESSEAVDRSRRSLDQSTVQGAVADRTRRPGSRGRSCAAPWSSAPGARITDAYVGPYTLDRRRRGDRRHRDRALDRPARRPAALRRHAPRVERDRARRPHRPRLRDARARCACRSATAPRSRCARPLDSRPSEATAVLFHPASFSR